jgi:hypothetical protein
MPKPRGNSGRTDPPLPSLETGTPPARTRAPGFATKTRLAECWFPTAAGAGSAAGATTSWGSAMCSKNDEGHQCNCLMFITQQLKID